MPDNYSEEKMCRKHYGKMSNSGNRHIECNVGNIWTCPQGCAICDWCDKKAKQPMVVN